MQAGLVVGAEQLAAGPDIGVLPCQRRGAAAGCGVDAHLGDLFAAQAEDKVVGGREAVGGWVAAPCGNGYPSEQPHLLNSSWL